MYSFVFLIFVKLDLIVNFLIQDPTISSSESFTIENLEKRLEDVKTPSGSQMEMISCI